MGQLTQNIAKLIAFAHLRHAELSYPVLLVLDEGDAIAQSRDEGQQHHEDISGVSAILQSIDHMRRNPGVALIMTTNRLSALDTALLSRGGAQKVYFPLPDYGMRFYLLMRLLGDIVSTGELRTLARSTEGFSHRDLVEMCQAAFLEAQSTYSPVTLRHLLRGAAAIGQPLLNGCQEGSQALVCRQNDHPLRPTDFGVYGNGHTAHKALA